MRQLKPLFANPPEELAKAVQNFRHAFAIMYDSHKYVCDKFEGGQPSLLMGDAAQKTAAEMIDTFKRNRLLVLGVPIAES
jgi:N-formylglutamate amidohydrolase